MLTIKIAVTAPANTKDTRKVFIGGESPSFGAIKLSDRK